MQKEKPDCYKCKWRGAVAGSAHSCCNHPKCSAVNGNSLLGLMSILGGARGGMPPMKTGLKVKGDPHGIRSGWFNHPFNFDPVWLEECDGFEVAEAAAKPILKSDPDISNIQVRLTKQNVAFLDELVVSETARIKVLQNRQGILNLVLRHYFVMRDTQNWSSLAEFSDMEEGKRTL